MPTIDTVTLDQPAIADGRGARRRAAAARPLLQLLAYARPYRLHATLTVGFGALGFLLSFVYPWIIGSVIDLIGSAGAALTADQRRHALARLTELAGITGLLH